MDLSFALPVEGRPGTARGRENGADKLKCDLDWSGTRMLFGQRRGSNELAPMADCTIWRMMTAIKFNKIAIPNDLYLFYSLYI